MNAFSGDLMLTESLAKALNAQVTAEFYSSSLYLSMAAWFENESLPGIAHWMKFQASEERTHGLKLFNHILERGNKAILEAIGAPPASFAGPEAIFKMVAEHESQVTTLINKLFELARNEKDFATETFLQWFVTEQVEEEAQAKLIYEQMKMVVSSKGSLLMLDHQLGKRAVAAA
jgi:ferritin